MNYKIRKVRNLLGMTQEEFSKEIGISRATLSKLENGKEEINESLISFSFMAIAKEQLRQIIAENDIKSVGDIYSLIKDSFKDMLQEL